MFPKRKLIVDFAYIDSEGFQTEQKDLLCQSQCLTIQQAFKESKKKNGCKKIL